MMTIRAILAVALVSAVQAVGAERAGELAGEAGEAARARVLAAHGVACCVACNKHLLLHTSKHTEQ